MKDNYLKSVILPGAVALAFDSLFSAGSKSGVSVPLLFRVVNNLFCSVSSALVQFSGCGSCGILKI